METLQNFLNATKELDIWNESLAQKLKQLGIRKLWITSYGNSIASGYSKIYPIEPFLFHNMTLEQRMEEYHIELKRFQFARANSTSEDCLNWLIQNTSQQELNQMNRSDYLEGPKKVPGEFCTLGIDNYYPSTMDHPIGLQDLIVTSEEELANIIIYNGLTDALFKKGVVQKVKGMKKNLLQLNQILSMIQKLTQERHALTQVYLCGIPELFGLSKVVNDQLKRIASQYQNVVYVESVFSQCFHIQNGYVAFDMHYSPTEYQLLYIKIMKQIVQNFELCQEKMKELARIGNFESNLEEGQSDYYKPERKFYPNSFSKRLKK